jgi:hypothetical protein
VEDAIDSNCQESVGPYVVEGERVAVSRADALCVRLLEPAVTTDCRKLADCGFEIVEGSWRVAEREAGADARRKRENWPNSEGLLDSEFIRTAEADTIDSN